VRAALDRNELMSAFVKLGVEMEVEEVAQIIRFCDADGNGTIDREEFLLLLDDGGGG
jgi:Ca2+-binding EF-hand superfamily protein